MEIIEVHLPEVEFERLNSVYPPTVKSSNVGYRAVELVMFYFRSRHEDCTFTEQINGYDLQVEWDGGEEKIEIKGTADKKIAFGKLKVSSERSHDLLVSGTPLYRVVSVYSRSPVIHILKYGEDFKMKKEPRWAVARV